MFLVPVGGGDLEVDGSAQEALELWRALLAGRWSLVEHFDRGPDRCFVMRENATAVTGGPPLSARDLQIVSRASLGHSNKRIACELALSSSTVANQLTSSARKLGMTSSDVLLHAFAVLGGGARAPVPRLTRMVRDGQPVVLIEVEITPSLPAALTAAEAEIAGLVAAGLSNAEIAGRRNTSVRTVANQLRSIYAKLEIDSRRQLRSLCSTGDRIEEMTMSRKQMTIA